MTRVAIIGNAGGGKSVLARYVSNTLGLPLHVIDDVQWRPGWSPAPQSDIARAHRAWLRDERWVIDGWGSLALIEDRLRAADTIVFVDLPLWVHYWSVTKRHVKALIGIREGWPPQGCSVRGTFRRLLRVMWRVHHEMRPAILSLLQNRTLADRVVHVRSRRDLTRFRALVLHQVTA